MNRLPLSLAIVVVVAFTLSMWGQRHPRNTEPASTPASPTAPTAAQAPAAEHVMHAMSEHHVHSSAHMKMTALRPPQPGDAARAEDVVRAARAVMDRYRDYHAAQNDGYRIFLPNLPQKMYHFTNYWYAAEAGFRFDPNHPTSLLYEKTGDGYRLVGVMYTAPARYSEDKLNARIPLSVAQWHAHVNLCVPPRDQRGQAFGPNVRFGLAGSIDTKEACDAAGGRFLPQVFGWMVHVYPDEQDTASIWSVERQMSQK